LALVIEGYVKNSLQVAGGVVGAVVGFVATLLLLELVGFGNRADPITSGILVLFVFAPAAGAIAGLLLGTTLAMRLRARENTGGLLRNSLKASAVVVALCAVAGTAYYATRSRRRRPGSTRTPPIRFLCSRSAFPLKRQYRIRPVR
jgi:hypothetical protein